MVGFYVLPASTPLAFVELAGVFLVHLLGGHVRIPGSAKASRLPPARGKIYTGRHR